MMREQLADAARKATYYPRKLFDKLLFWTILKKSNDWGLLDRFFNEDILIVGNGPSINETPLENIGMASIGMNKINLLFDKTTWRPDMIVCTNGLVLRQNRAFFNSTDIILILPVRACYLGIKRRSNVLFVNIIDRGEMSPDVTRTMSNGCTVTFFALQIAAFLNPKSVNIVGVDHNFTYEGKDQGIKKMAGEDLNHFNPDYFKGQYWATPNLSGSEKLYVTSKHYFDGINVPIKDFTVNGKLKIFDKGKIDQLLKK